MGKYESVTIFDGQFNSMKMNAPDNNGMVVIEVVDPNESCRFYTNTDKQSDIIQHFLNFNPDCKDLALKRMSYELLTMRTQFDGLIESYRLLKIENERLQTLI